jgi:hypothetical protein
MALGDNEPFIAKMSAKHLPHPCRETGPALGIYRGVMFAAKHGFTGPLKPPFTTFYHIAPNYTFGLTDCQ